MCTWGHIPVIPVFGRVRQKDQELKVSLGKSARLLKAGVYVVVLIFKG